MTHTNPAHRHDHVHMRWHFSSRPGSAPLTAFGSQLTLRLYAKLHRSPPPAPCSSLALLALALGLGWRLRRGSLALPAQLRLLLLQE